MKKLIALILCIMLLTAAACAEGTHRQLRDPAEKAGARSVRSMTDAQPESEEIETTVDGHRLIMDEIAVTIDGQTFEPDFTAVVESSVREDSLDGFFCLNYEGEELLQMLLGIGAYGTRIAVGDSQLYTYSPEYFADFFDEPMMVQMFSEIQFTSGEEPASMSELAFDFADMLGLYGEDEFTLDIPRTLQWLERRLGLGSGMLYTDYNSVAGEMGAFPTVKVRSEFGQYTFTIGEEDPVHLTLTRMEDLVTIKNNESDFQLGAQFHADGTIQISYGMGAAHSFAEGQWMNLKYKFTPDEAGGGEFSLTYEFREYGKTFVYAAGTVDADGRIDGNVRITDEGGVMGIAVEAGCRIRTEAAELIDRTAGRRERIINEDSDEAFNGIVLAAVGMMGDLERLYADEAVVGMVDAYYAALEAMYESYAVEPDMEISDLPFEVPEFTYIPEGFEKGEEWIFEQYYSVDFTAGEERSLTISMSQYGGEELYAYVSGEGMTPVEDTIVTYSATDVSSNMSLNENGVRTNIYTYDIALPVEEIEKILEGRVWNE